MSRWQVFWDGVSIKLTVAIIEKKDLLYYSNQRCLKGNTFSNTNLYVRYGCALFHVLTWEALSNLCQTTLASDSTIIVMTINVSFTHLYVGSLEFFNQHGFKFMTFNYFPNIRNKASETNSRLLALEYQQLLKRPLNIHELIRLIHLYEGASKDQTSPQEIKSFPSIEMKIVFTMQLWRIWSISNLWSHWNT